MYRHVLLGYGLQVAESGINKSTLFFMAYTLTDHKNDFKKVQNTSGIMYQFLFEISSTCPNCAWITPYL